MCCNSVSAPGLTGERGRSSTLSVCSQYHPVVFGLCCQDDVGVSHRLSLGAIARAGRVWFKRLPRLTLLRSVAQLRRFMMSSATLIGVGLAALLLVTIRVAIDEPGVGLWFLVFSPVYTALFALGVIVVRAAIGVRSGLPEWACAMLLADRQCPNCAYAIATDRCSADDLVRCPECGAAWLAWRLGAHSETPRETVTIEPLNRPAIDRMEEQVEGLASNAERRRL